MGVKINNGAHVIFNIIAVILYLQVVAPSTAGASGAGRGGDGKWIIVIDPGHGGKDPGAIGKFSRESDINLAIAVRTGQYIQENHGNARVIYTRTDDSAVDLIERPRVANRNNADIFISIHTNSWKNPSAAGAETYIMGLAKDEENLAVAMKENEVITLEDDYTTKYQQFDPKSPESYIIFTLTRNVYQKQSTDLAMKIQARLTEKVEREDRGVKQAGFWVLFNTTMPGVLVETGFISNSSEEKILNTPEGQDRVAMAISRACIDYINEVDARSGGITPADFNTGNAATDSKRDNAGTIYFRVQVSASSSRCRDLLSDFKGLTDIAEICEQNRYKYTTGNFTSFTDAVKHRKKIEAIYPDAFVIAVKDNKIVPLQQALEETKARK